MSVRTLGLVMAVAVMSGACSTSSSTQGDRSTPALSRVKHLVVVYLENWSFDSLYGSFAGADTFTTPTRPFAAQVAKDGSALSSLPPVMDTSKKPPVPDPRFATTMPNAPFALEATIPPTGILPDLVHRFYQEQAQIDGGRMDKFAAISDAGGLVMGHYDTSGLPLAQEAKNYTLADNFFHAAFGGSFLNHFWLVCGCTPVFPDAPADAVANLAPDGTVVTDGYVTPDGYAVNTAFSRNTPHPATTPVDHLVPSQTLPTIGDRLSAKGISWAWYAGGWNDALAGHADKLFQYHHQPFVFFANFADGTPARAAHLRDETEFVAAAKAGRLPSVSFVKPIGANNEHPGYATLAAGEAHALKLINAVRGGPSWKDTVVVVTYDENGGFWDHVAPPGGDRWGPGARVPALVVSDLARKHYVDHTTYDTTSILATIEHRFGLPPLGDRDAKAQDLSPTLRR